MTLIDKQQAALDKLNAKFRAYKDDVRHHAGWEHEEEANKSSRKNLLLALSEFDKLMFTHESNAKPLCDIRLDKYCGIDDLAAIVEAISLPCDQTNAN